MLLLLFIESSLQLFEAAFQIEILAVDGFFFGLERVAFHLQLAYLICLLLDGIFHVFHFGLFAVAGGLSRDTVLQFFPLKLLLPREMVQAALLAAHQELLHR